MDAENGKRIIEEMLDGITFWRKEDNNLILMFTELKSNGLGLRYATNTFLENKPKMPMFYTEIYTEEKDLVIMLGTMRGVVVLDNLTTNRISYVDVNGIEVILTKTNSEEALG